MTLATIAALGRVAGAALRVAPALLVLGALAGPVRAQDAPRRTGPVFAEPLRVHDELPPAAPAAAPAYRGAHAASAQFVVTYVGFPQEARVAFQAAVDRWSASVTSSVPIRITATWSPLDAGILGSAGPYLVMNFSGAPISNTWYASALADALAGRDVDPGRADIEATFNSQFGRWHFNPSTPPPEGCNCYDLATVVLHELGHGLGFIGSLDVENDVGVVGAEDASGNEDGVPFAYDRFTETEAGRPLLDFPNRSSSLAAALRDDTFFDGSAVRASHGDRAPLFSPPFWIPGSSYSHLDEQAFPAGGPNALMTPYFAQREQIAAPDTLACAVLADMGWPLGATCAEMVPEDSLPTRSPGFTLALAPDAPNPSRNGTAVRLTVVQSQRVRVGLYDLAGRRIADLFDRVLPGGGDQLIAVPGGVATGVYVVRADGEDFTGGLLVTLVR